MKWQNIKGRLYNKKISNEKQMDQDKAKALIKEIREKLLELNTVIDEAPAEEKKE